jgi:hypothetical protein
MDITLIFAELCIAQPTISTFTDFLDVCSSEMELLEKVDDDLAQVIADKKEVEEQKKVLSQLLEDKIKESDKAYQEKIGRVSAAVQNRPCSFALQVPHLCLCMFRHRGLG